MSEPLERLSGRVSGRVQGVGYRFWLVRRAAELGLRGWVMNAADERSVELLAEGPPEVIALLERELHIGPSGARVDSVDVRHSPASGEFRGFTVMRP